MPHPEVDRINYVDDHQISSSGMVAGIPEHYPDKETMTKKALHIRGEYLVGLGDEPISGSK